MKQNLLLLSISEPLHVGSGEGLGGIDRPIFREVTTNYPAIPSSSLKGALKATVAASHSKGDIFKAVFGVGETAGNQGCVAIPDAKLLLFPARSLAGTMVWATSILPIVRFYEALLMCETHGCLADELKPGLAELQKLTGIDFPETAQAMVSTKSENQILVNKKLALESFVLSPVFDETNCFDGFAAWLADLLFPNSQVMKDYFIARLVILSDNEFSWLVTNRTQVDANIAMTDMGVTNEGSLRYTEYLPPESVMFSTVNIVKPFMAVKLDAAEDFVSQQIFSSGYAQFGADESKGRGICRTKYCHNSGPVASGEIE